MLRFVERYHHICRFTHNPLALNHAEITRVETIVPIIAHHEILTLRNSHGTITTLRRKARYRHDRMTPPWQFFQGEDALLPLRFRQLAGYLRAQRSVIDTLAIN